MTKVLASLWYHSFFSILRFSLVILINMVVCFSAAFFFFFLLLCAIGKCRYHTTAHVRGITEAQESSFARPESKQKIIFSYT